MNQLPEMKSLIRRFVALEREISNEKGEFSLFALFLRVDAQNEWDLVISAPWLPLNRKQTLDYLADRLRAHLDDRELLAISRIIIIDEDNPGLDAITRGLEVQHGQIEVRDSIFFGLEIKHAYIISSLRPKALSDTTQP